MVETKRNHTLRKNIIRNYNDDDLAEFLQRIYEHGRSCHGSVNCQFCNFKMCKGREYIKNWIDKEIGSGKDSFDSFNEFPIL